MDAKNRNRVMRMLEKIHDGDDHSAPNAPRYDCLKLGVTWERSVLRDRIDERLERRLNQGMIEEVQRLMDEGASLEFLMKLGLEYRFIARYLTGEIESREEMVSLLATAITGVMARPGDWLLHGLFAKETGAIQMLLPAVKPWMDLARVALLYGTGMAVVLLPVNTAARMEQFRPKWWQAAALAVLTAWSVLSFTGITTFIYSNF